MLSNKQFWQKKHVLVTRLAGFKELWHTLNIAINATMTWCKLLAEAALEFFEKDIDYYESK